MHLSRKLRQQVIENLLLEEPVLHATFDGLRLIDAQVKGIDGTYAPGVVIAVLPVKETILPIATTLVPPLTCRIAVVLTIFV